MASWSCAFAAGRLPASRAMRVIPPRLSAAAITPAQRVRAALAAGFDDEEMPFPVEDFGQGEVEAAFGPGAGVHRDAEAGSARHRAVERDDEGAFAPRPVGRVGVAVAEQDPVLDRDRVQLAGAHADESVARRLLRRRFDAEPGAVPPCAPQAQARFMQESFPGLRPHRVAEQRLVVAPLEAAGAPVLAVRPPPRQPRDSPRRRVTPPGADRLVAVGAQRVQQLLQVGPLEQPSFLTRHEGDWTPLRRVRV